MNSLRISATRFMSRAEGQPVRLRRTKIGGNPYFPKPRARFPQWENGGRKGNHFPQRVEAPALAKRRLLPYFGPAKGGNVLSPESGKNLHNHRKLRNL